MEGQLRQFRDRLRLILILYTFCDTKKASSDEGIYGVFRSEIRIQAIDFLIRYPDFLSMELLNLMKEKESIDKEEIKIIVKDIYINKEPVLKVEEMQKFFHGAYESIDQNISYLTSVGFIKYESKRRVDGTKYERLYFVTKYCADRIEFSLRDISTVDWYFKRCKIINKYFGHFSGSELKSRQYKYKEYSEISYKNHIEQINSKVIEEYKRCYKEELV